MLDLNRLKFALVYVLAFLSSATAHAECDVAKILFGKVQFEIIPHSGGYGSYESAVIRGGDFDSKQFGSGRFLGEITVDRGGFAIRNLNAEVIGVISPALEIGMWSDGCDKTTIVKIHKIKAGAYAIMNGDSIVGTIQGRFPQNSFGVK